MKLLLVEDERRMAEAEAEVFRQENYDVDVCYDGESGLDAALSGIYDAVILDVMLPKRDGFSVIREIRREGLRTPVLMLTAKSELADKVSGLDAGADDYLTKPFMVEELLARVRALCRRNMPAMSAEDGRLHAGDLILDIASATLLCSTTGQEIRLGEKELHLMEYLMEKKGSIVPREKLALKVWGYESNAEYNNVEVYISFTRKKLAFIGSGMEIKAVRGLGYELRKQNV
ncbi:MAG: response regulator transcription factor [Lachnospiraceae bacterium]|nr:response regulator transcription factor [Lachnospiraceae bacterium]MCD7765288.1 response regulator transcription factor [Lachnospiraceae bacterium]